MSLIDRLQTWAIDPLGPLEETLEATKEVLEPIASHYVYGALPSKYQESYAQSKKIPRKLPTRVSCVGKMIYNLAKIELASEISDAAPILNLPLWAVKIYASAAIISSATRLILMNKLDKPIGAPSIRILDDVRRGMIYLFNIKNY